MVESAGTVTGTLQLGAYWGLAFVCLITVVMVAAIFLQIRLSLSDRRWPGLILPAIAFAGAVIYLVKGGAFFPLAVAPMEPLEVVVLVSLLLLNANRYTAALLSLYAACRLWGQRKRRKQELNKMNSQDLS